MPRLIVLSGPSCVGKSPLLHALQRYRPDLANNLQKLILYNDRAPRPGETDGVAYHFRPRHFIESLRDQPGFVVMPVRRDLQALELAQVEHILAAGRDPLFEGNVYLATHLLQAPRLAHLPRLSVFLSPLSLEEIRYLQAQGADLRQVVAEIMRRKLLYRTRKQKAELGEDDLRDVEARCGAAFAELQYAPLFDAVLPNHDGESSSNWNVCGYTLGDALRCLEGFAALLSGQQPRGAEKWPEGLLD